MSRKRKAKSTDSPIFNALLLLVWTSTVWRRQIHLSQSLNENCPCEHLSTAGSPFYYVALLFHKLFVYYVLLFSRNLEPMHFSHVV